MDFEEVNDTSDGVAYSSVRQMVSILLLSTKIKSDQWKYHLLHH